MNPTGHIISERSYVMLTYMEGYFTIWLTDEARIVRQAQNRYWDVLLGRANDPKTWEDAAKALARFGAKKGMPFNDLDLPF
jgi:hypothetical protein